MTFSKPLFSILLITCGLCLHATCLTLEIRDNSEFPTTESETDDSTTILYPDEPIFLQEPKEPNVLSNQSNYQPAAPDLKLILDSGLRVENSTIFGKAACRCGTPNLGTRIVNGKPVKITELPWTVGLARPGKGFFGLGGTRKPFCGGTLVNNQYVVTASHCVDGTFPSKLKVLMNLQDDFTSTFTPASVFVVDVEQIKMHPEYSRDRIDNDIALIKLAKPVLLADPRSNIVPACLPSSNENDFSGQTATVAGWGTVFSFGPQSLGLQKVDVPIISNQVCNTETTYENKISDNMLCAGFVKEGGKDSCQGDSGGPLVVKDGDRHTLVGVVSWGYACAQPKSPGVYTRVGRYPAWITENAKDAEWCGE